MDKTGTKTSHEKIRGKNKTMTHFSIDNITMQITDHELNQVNN